MHNRNGSALLSWLGATIARLMGRARAPHDKVAPRPMRPEARQRKLISLRAQARRAPPEFA